MLGQHGHYRQIGRGEVVAIVGDNGAYASVGGKVLERAAGHACGAYRVPNVDVEARAVYTNNPPCGAMRGFGAPQVCFAYESAMDALAAKLAAQLASQPDLGVLIRPHRELPVQKFSEVLDAVKRAPAGELPECPQCNRFLVH